MKTNPKSKHICNSHKPTHKPKIAKELEELALPTHGQKDNAAKMKDKLTEKTNNETLTKAICNKGFNGKSSILPRINFGVGRQESSPQSLTAYSLNRYSA